MNLNLIILVPFLASVCAALLLSNARNVEAWLAGFVALASAVLVAILYPQVAGGGVGVVRASLLWVPQLGLDIHLRMDGYAGCSRCW